MIIGTAAAGVFFLFGRMSSKKKKWAFIVGMIIYALDGLIFLLVNDVKSIAFHIFALVCIYKGFSANKKLNSLIKNEAISNENTININVTENAEMINS